MYDCANRYSFASVENRKKKWPLFKSIAIRNPESGSIQQEVS